MRAFTFLSASFLLFATSVVACAASEDEEPDPTLQARAASAAATVATSECDVLARCSPDAFARRFSSKAACEAQVTQARAAELGAPGVRATPEAVAACATARAALACSDQGRYVPACEFSRGTKPRSQACSSDLQCDTGRCLISPGGTCGACAEPRAALGETCTKTVECKPGLRCQRDDLADGSVCVPLPKTGEPCATGSPACIDGLACVEGACAPLGTHGPGEACKTSASCVDGQALACVDGACTARTQVGPGEPCNEKAAGAAAIYCKGAATCRQQLDDDGKPLPEQRCMPRKPLGQACDASREDCEGNAWCNDGTCVLKAHVCDY